jgi:hypothetical protein
VEVAAEAGFTLGVFEIALLYVFQLHFMFFSQTVSVSALSSRKNCRVMRAPKEIIYEL